MNFDLNTNLIDVPYGIFSQLAKQLDREVIWTKLLQQDCDGPYGLSPGEFDRYRRMQEPGSQLLRLLGNRGLTVKTFLTRLHELAKVHGSELDLPQLIIHRRFCSVIWSRSDEILVTIVGEDQSHLKLQCKASGFPTPRYQWFEEEKPLENATSSSLVISRCPCTARDVFRCRVWNLVEADRDWSHFYRMPGKTFQSELMSKVVDLKSYAQPTNRCDWCRKSSVEDVYRIVQQNIGTNIHQQQQDDEANNHPMLTTVAEELVASDKVALIISNRAYAPHMPNLITPHCDAETLAELLQQLKFKTVTLSDLNLEEMRFIVHEYRKLLGDGVYAIFYFVGHGFEANGQCYLLPVGAPSGNYGPEDCLSIDWLMSVFRDFNPALNLVLLDICRKFLPCNLDAFAKYSEQFRHNVKVNRNTVYGYATSGGVGAYEVKGENNGVFMKYLKKRISQKLPLIDMLNKVFRDVERDKKVRDVQIPELRSNLTQSRSLLDPLVTQGHTTSYDHHTFHWQLIHELPVPIHITFPEHQLLVTIWFDYVGHFTNKVYVFSSVGDLPTEQDDEQSAVAEDERKPSSKSLTHLAYLRFSSDLETSAPKVYNDDEEGLSLCLMLSNLQRCHGEVKCIVELRLQETPNEVFMSKEVTLGFILITQLTPISTPDAKLNIEHIQVS